ncbi:MAG: IS4 family transposase [Desulfovermiculus sp.]|nr:IS4 family transposase [Desulfovermiculus sp.]
MHTQNQIKRILAQPEHIEYVSRLITRNKYPNSKELAKAICRDLGFFDIRGLEQHGGCLKALRELEAAGHFALPIEKTKHRKHLPQRLHAPVPLATEVPHQVDRVRGLELVLVDTKEKMRIWNEMMLCEHYLGAGPFVGRQLRYLIDSEHGLLGGLGFAASALHVADRDAWIGWDREHRQQYLHYVVGLSRFLIRPCIRCKNLASKVLGMAAQVMPNDFEKQYNYRPLLLETFVDPDFSGTSLKAANWHRVGQTKGRGRQEKKNKPSLPVKDIYIYVLDGDFRSKIGLQSQEVIAPLDVGDGLDSDQWAKNEFGGAPLGDLRSSNRLIRAAEDMSEHPGVSYSGLPGIDWAATKGYYRMLDNPDESAVCMANILRPHRKRTIQRMSAVQDVLCIQDGTDLNYNNLDKCKGLGVIGKNQTNAQIRGLYLHSSLAVTPEGLPLGVLHATCNAPTPRSAEDARPSNQVPIEEKKNYVWIEHHRDLVQIKQDLPDTRLIHVCDREADFFELFDEQRKYSCVELLVRAQYHRNINGGSAKLFGSVSQGQVLGGVNVIVPRQSERSKTSKKKAKPKREEREATLFLRAKKVKLHPGRHLAHKAPVSLWVVHALEEHPPANDEPVEWFLLTTMHIATFEDALKCLSWYCKRWRVEDWHRVLKSGCKIEDLSHETAERLRRAIAINLVIAWRIMLMTLLGREAPELPAEVLFSDTELKVLGAYAQKKETPTSH